jgi:hypothetical protein
MDGVERLENQVRRISTAAWTGFALIMGLAIVLMVHTFAAPSQRLGMALRATARWSFLWFCLATYGGALRTLFGRRFQALASQGRDFGLAFASAHLVHVALVVWLLSVFPDPIPRLSLVIFTIGVLWIYVLAAFSLSPRLSARLGPWRWKAVRTIGVEYIAFAYAFEFGGRILNGNRANALHYSPLFAAALAGPMLRLSAWMRRRFNAANAVGLLSG